MALAEVRLDIADGVATLEAHGEFDIATARTLTDALRKACAAGLDVRLDLADVSFLDVCCLRSVTTAQTQLARSGCTIEIVNAPRMVRRLFEATAAGGLLAQDADVLAVGSGSSESPFYATDDGRSAGLRAQASGLAIRLPRMRGELARLAESVAAVEDRIAATMDSRAATTPQRADELRSVADSARRMARVGRDLVGRYSRST